MPYGIFHTPTGTWDHPSHNLMVKLFEKKILYLDEVQKHQNWLRRNFSPTKLRQHHLISPNHPAPAMIPTATPPLINGLHQIPHPQATTTPAQYETPTLSSSAAGPSNLPRYHPQAFPIPSLWHIWHQAIFFSTCRWFLFLKGCNISDSVSRQTRIIHFSFL